MRFSDILDTLQRDADGGFTAQTPDSWSQGRTLFGGLQAALLVRAMRSQVDADVPLRTLQTTFVGPVTPGPLHLRVETLRQGKSVTHVDARIVSEAGIGCTALGVFGRGRPSRVVLAPPRPAISKTAEASPRMPYFDGVTPTFTQFIEQRWATGAMPYCGGESARTQIYVRYPDEPQVTESLVIALADTIPSPALSILKKPAMASSMTWTLELLVDDLGALPAGYWLMDAEVSAGSQGYLAQSATLWSPDHRAVALSRQSVVIFD